MTEGKSPDAGERIEPLPSIEKAKRVMENIKDLKLQTETVNFLRGLPPMIMQNGLGQTIAFMKSKSKDHGEYGKILEIFNNLFNKGDLIKDILNLTPEKYIQMQKEAIEYAGWMKKFALAFNDPDEEKKDAPTAS